MCDVHLILLFVEIVKIVNDLGIELNLTKSVKREDINRTANVGESISLPLQTNGDKTNHRFKEHSSEKTEF